MHIGLIGDTHAPRDPVLNPRAAPLVTDGRGKVALTHNRMHEIHMKTACLLHTGFGA
ncbi:hypothetical protein GALL_462690 [mine drainage metagenome]|uniref:Uncharacterized protein n=1 Tax=mine drainage metagenome TaxID=410659 RepID=A0A1J5Q842_9ZZZZ